jgi:drug/metabolite transporter (DMT)-like permease
MSRTKPWAIPIVIACTLFTSIGALFIKQGVDKFEEFTLSGLLPAYPIIIGLFFYFLGFILLTISFKHGELSTLFPFVSLSFVWVAILSTIVLKESVSLIEGLGVGVIVLGVVLIGIAGKNNKLKLRK